MRKTSKTTNLAAPHMRGGRYKNDLYFGKEIMDEQHTDALTKYAKYYEDINPNQLASINDAGDLSRKIMLQWPNIGMPTEVVAIPSGMTTAVANHTPLSAFWGFPVDKPINIHLVYGEKKEDEYEGNTRIINVALAKITPLDALYLEVKPKA